MLRHLLIAAALLTGTGASVATGFGLETRATAQPSVETCPDRLGSDTSSLVCRCGSNASDGGTIWGADVYTADSPICKAAVHAGVIGPSGGVVEVREAPGRSSYSESTRNGVSSSAYGSYARSIVFTGGRAPGMQDCPTRMGSDSSMVCRCTGDATGDTGTIWGSGVYTADSPICRAAVHAGVIGRSGGVVDVRDGPGRASYSGTTRNGVTSSSYGSYDRSIRFNDAGDGK